MNENMIKETMKEAKKAGKKGNPPFGAVLCDKEGNIIGRSYNRAKTNMDPTAHAEILLIRKMCKKLNTRDLSQYIMYVNAEPCPMCMSAIIKAKIVDLVYGADIEEDAKLFIRAIDISKNANYKMKIVSGILKDDCANQILAERNKNI